MTEQDFDQRHFRQVMGQFPTGVVVVTALGSTGEPLGMTVGSFTSVSLEPPMVAFLPDQSSSSWAALRASGDRFCVNILGSHQEEECRLVAMRRQNKFEGISWRPSPAGLPLIDGAVAYMDCATEVVHEAGDHHIVIGRVTALDIESPAAVPLLFFRGGYGSFMPLSLAAGDADLVEHLRLVDLVRHEMEELSASFDTQVTSTARVRDEIVLTVAAGTSTTSTTPTRVGQRLPFIPPVGSVFAAFGNESLRETWLAGLGPGTNPQVLDHYREIPERIRRQGYSVALNHRASTDLDHISNQLADGDPSVTADDLRVALREMDDYFNPAELRRDALHELHMLSAPVFRTDGDVAFTLNLWGPKDPVTGSEIERHASELVRVAQAATQAYGGVSPAREDGVL